MRHLPWLIRSWRAKKNSLQLCDPSTRKTKNSCNTSTLQVNSSLTYSRRQCIISTNTALLTRCWTLRKLPLPLQPPLLLSQKKYPQQRHLTRAWKLSEPFFAARYYRSHWSQSSRTSSWSFARSDPFLPITSACHSLSSARGKIRQTCRRTLPLRVTFTSVASITLAASRR